MKHPQEERNLLQHKVIIDEYTSLNLSLPEEMNALDIMGILQKLNRILKVTQLEGSAVIKQPTADGSMYNRKAWTPEEDAIILAALDSHTGTKQKLWHKLGEELNRSPIAVYGRYKVKLKKGGDVIERTSPDVAEEEAKERVAEVPTH